MPRKRRVTDEAILSACDSELDQVASEIKSGWGPGGIGALRALGRHRARLSASHRKEPGPHSPTCLNAQCPSSA